MFQADVEALKNGRKDEARGLKYDSIMNTIKYFHCCEIGFLPPCIMHDGGKSGKGKLRAEGELRQGEKTQGAGWERGLGGRSTSRSE